MSRIIKFPLVMPDGTEARSLEELKIQFDMKTVLKYYLDGRLEKWLSAWEYPDKAERVSELSKDDDKINKTLCEIFEVEYKEEYSNVSINTIEKELDRLDKLMKFTTEKEILDKLDFVAFSQEELDALLEENPSKVYLCGEEFILPAEHKNIEYIGINNPFVSFDMCFEGTQEGREIVITKCKKGISNKSKLNLIGKSVFWGTNHNIPVEWQILDIEDNRVLLLSKFGLEYRKSEEIDEQTGKGFGKGLRRADRQGIIKGPFLLSEAEFNKYAANLPSCTIRPEIAMLVFHNNQILPISWWLSQKRIVHKGYYDTKALCFVSEDGTILVETDDKPHFTRPAVLMNANFVKKLLTECEIMQKLEEKKVACYKAVVDNPNESIIVEVCNKHKNCPRCGCGNDRDACYCVRCGHAFKI